MSTKLLLLGLTQLESGDRTAGVGAFGQAGVERVLDLLNRELRIAMVGSGTPTVESVGPDYVIDAGYRVPRGRLGRELL